MTEFNDTEMRLFQRVVAVGKTRGKREAAEAAALAKAIRASILPALPLLAANPAVLLEVFVAIEMAATQANARRIAAHPLRPEGVDEEIAGRLAAEPATTPSIGRSSVMSTNSVIFPGGRSEHRLEELFHIEQQRRTSCVASSNIRIEARQQPAGPRKHLLSVPDGPVQAETFNVAGRDPSIAHLVKAMQERRHHRPDPRA